MTMTSRVLLSLVARYDEETRNKETYHQFQFSIMNKILSLQVEVMVRLNLYFVDLLVRLLHNEVNHLPNLLVIL